MTRQQMIRRQLGKPYPGRTDQILKPGTMRGMKPKPMSPAPGGMNAPQPMKTPKGVPPVRNQGINPSQRAQRRVLLEKAFGPNWRQKVRPSRARGSATAPPLQQIGRGEGNLNPSLQGDINNYKKRQHKKRRAWKNFSPPPWTPTRNV